MLQCRAAPVPVFFSFSFVGMSICIWSHLSEMSAVTSPSNFVQFLYCTRRWRGSSLGRISRMIHIGSQLSLELVMVEYRFASGCEASRATVKDANTRRMVRGTHA